MQVRKCNRLSQQELELRVFDRFVKHTEYAIISRRPCDPPEADIFCQTDRGALYFELTDNTAEETQRAIHSANPSIRGKAYWFSPFPPDYKQKFTKHYDTHSLRCDLIIYFGIHPVAELGPHFDDRLAENIVWIRQHMPQAAFAKVWIFDYHQDKVLSQIDK